MNSDRTAFALSVPCGTWFGIQVRVNLWFFLVGLALCLRLQDVALGLTFTGILFVSVLFHEVGHILAARASGGSGDEIHITPFGGLAMCSPAPNTYSRFATASGGLLVNLAFCCATLWPVLNSEYGIRWWDPFTLPRVEILGQTITALIPALLLLTFKANWLLLLVNLLPVHPLDGGRMLHIVLHARLETQSARTAYVRIGAFVGAMMVVLGLIFENVWVMGLGTVVLLLNMHEEFRMHTQEEESEDFMGYDFSEGYTSLERSGGTEPQQPGLVERWRQQRDDERRRRLEEEEREMEQTLDMLLEKLHLQGEAALTPVERKQLQQISDRIRNRNRP